MFENSEQIIQKFTSASEDKKADYLKRENSNYVYSLPLLRHNLNNYAEERFLFQNVLPPRIKELYDEGIVYVHDKQLAPYCVSISCLDIAMKGIPTLAKNMITSKPTKRLSILLRHFSNVVTLISQQVSGAVMLAQLSTIAASYLHDEALHNHTYEKDELKQMFQSLIWELNMPLRSGAQSSFSNITLEFGKPSEEIKEEYVVIGGVPKPIKYKDIPCEYFDYINQAIIDVMSEGTGSDGIPFTFPLLTVQIDDEFNYNNPMFLELLDKMYNWGGVYFENFKSKPFEDAYYKKLNPMIQPKDPEVSRSLCCRLQINLETLSKAGGGIFGSSTGSTGAVQVLNLNMNRLLIEYGDDISLAKQKMAEFMEVMQDAHMAKRKWIEQNKELFPTFFSYNHNLKNYFNVFAVTGMHEGLINLGYENGIKDSHGKLVAHELMQYMTKIVNHFIIRDKVACGIEYAPAENAAIKLARHDKKWAEKNGRKIFTQGEGENPYLTSGCMTPFSEEDFLAQLENSAEFQGYATSGSVLHHFLEAKVSPERLAHYIDRIFQKPINYITLTPTITSCMDCGQKIIAEDAKNVNACPTCESTDIATFSRVIGYLKMIARNNIAVNEKGYYEGKYNFWSKARRHDWNERKRLKEKEISFSHGVR
ncbi:ribonucleoside-triphosphate reductase [Gracilibacillus ureilyticus]|uniref:Ribonucleoside-triphosphate reductase n=1 Tax=Gracilibacillus ureilyticus TaxID=531814 RepID=A0A1H9QR57_9BACI|nr:anaerobic ribonucleoside-triphosphate reductase [Gracilibacillus ureilyticus]SER62319.1 ribonucleoside-triphosphate reductase [Gracilibacillus ureilyticus]